MIKRFPQRSGLRFGHIAILLLLAVVTAACAGTTPEEEGGAEGQLVWAIGGSEAKPGGIHQEVARLWSRENPDNPIRIEVLPDEADQQREQQSLELNAQGSGFDVLGVDVIWTGEYAQNGWLESLEDIRSEIEEVTIPSALETATWEGRLWAAPYNSNAAFLYYRTDLIDEPPTTWDEAKRMGQQAAQGDVAPFVGQGARYEGLVVNFLEYYWGTGGELFNEQATEVLFDTDRATRALNFMRESRRDGFYAPGFNTMTEEEARNAFQSGKAVFMRNWPYTYALMQDEKQSQVAGKFGIAPLPTFTGEGTTSALGGFNNAVSAFSNNKQAAKDFVLWASTNERVQEMMAREATLPPTMQSVYDKLSDDPVMALLGRVLPEAEARPPAPEWNNISVEMQQQIFPAYNGQKDPQEAVEAIRNFLEGTVRE